MVLVMTPLLAMSLVIGYRIESSAALILLLPSAPYDKRKKVALLFVVRG